MKVKFLVFAVVTAITLYLIPVEPVSAGWYVGGAIGNADDDELDDDDSGTKLLGGYQFNENFGVEGAFVDLGDFDEPPGTLSQEGVAIEAIARYPLGDRFSIFGKAGFFRWDAERSSGKSFDGTDNTFGFGGEYRLNDNWALRAEWERFSDVLGGDVDMISFGATYSFAPAYSRPKERPAKKAEPKPEPLPAPVPKPKKDPTLVAAEQGDANAQFKLGHLYSIGKGVPKNASEAIKWYRQAADQGHARAQYNLGAAYVNGAGVRSNKQTAIDWFFKAGRSFVRDGKRDLAIVAVDTIERLSPGNRKGNQLLTEIRSKFGQ
ncbi:MAG: outer membrane beta-barrel protein [Gammaproteobacteria bacterium]|nr:outer membrane beta-barrel protein [Gammaproteobacteria bacterium]